MSSVIKVFDKDSDEYKRLELFAKMFNQTSGHIKLSVNKALFDIGQKKQWTTLLANDSTDKITPGRTWQALTLRNQQDILDGDNDLWFETLEMLLHKYNT